MSAHSVIAAALASKTTRMHMLDLTLPLCVSAARVAALVSPSVHALVPALGNYPAASGWVL